MSSALRKAPRATPRPARQVAQASSVDARSDQRAAPRRTPLLGVIHLRQQITPRAIEARGRGFFYRCRSGGFELPHRPAQSPWPTPPARQRRQQLSRTTACWVSLWPAITCISRAIDCTDWLCFGQRGGYFMNAGTGVADCLAGQFHALGGHPGFCCGYWPAHADCRRWRAAWISLVFAGVRSACRSVLWPISGIFPRVCAPHRPPRSATAFFFASAGGFHRGVQGQQIGLVGDFRTWPVIW